MNHKKSNDLTVRVDALIELLIEKGLISRQDLAEKMKQLYPLDENVKENHAYLGSVD